MKENTKNFTLLTKTGFTIVVANHSFFKLLLKTFRKTIFSENPGVPQILGTIRWHILDDCNEKCPKTSHFWRKPDSGLCLSIILSLNCFWKPFEKRSFSVNPGLPQFLGTIRWHILGDSNKNSPKTSFWRKLDSGLCLQILSLNCFWKSLEKLLYFLWKTRQNENQTLLYFLWKTLQNENQTCRNRIPWQSRSKTTIALFQQGEKQHMKTFEH